MSIRNQESKICTHCGEHNHPSRRLCWSCKSELTSDQFVGDPLEVVEELINQGTDRVLRIFRGKPSDHDGMTLKEAIANDVRLAVNAAIKTIREEAKSQERWTGGTLILRMEQVGATGLADEINAELTSMVSMFEYSLNAMTRTANSFDTKTQELEKELKETELDLKGEREVSEKLRSINEAAHDQLAEAYRQNADLQADLRQAKEAIRAGAEQFMLKCDCLARAEAFKDFVHRRLDSANVPKEFPGGKHTLKGCRIGDRLDWVFSCLPSGERQFPMQKGPSIPWKLAELLYVGYSAQYGTQQSLERLAQRGGFGWAEIQAFWEKDKQFRPAIEAAQAANLPPKPAEDIWESEVVDFWKRMFTRAKCGCLALDCRVHGAYDPADVKRVQEAILHE